MDVGGLAVGEGVDEGGEYGDLLLSVLFRFIRNLPDKPTVKRVNLIHPGLFTIYRSETTR